MDDVSTEEDGLGVVARTSPLAAEPDDMAPNIIGLGLIVAGIIFMVMGGIVLWILGVICLIGGVGAMFLTWQRKRRATA